MRFKYTLQLKPPVPFKELKISNEVFPRKVYLNDVLI